MQSKALIVTFKITFHDEELCERSSSEEGGDRVSICLIKMVMMMMMMVTMMRMNMLIRLSELDRNS